MLLKTLEIEITRKCNLNCTYCYLGNKNTKTISYKNLDKALELLSPETKVMFYGGEPLIEFKLIKYFVEKAGKRKYTIMTNGTIMNDEILSFVKEHDINLYRGMNGCKEAQEKTRPNTFEKFEKITKILEEKKVIRRMTITPDTTEYIMDSIKYIESIGDIGFTPMPDYYANWSKEDIKLFIDMLWKVGDYYIEQFKLGKPFYMYFISKEAAKRFTNQHCKIGCGAGKSLHCMSVDGEIKLCHRFANEPKNSPFILHNDEYGKIVNDHFEKTKNNIKSGKCEACIAQYGCEMNCYHVNYKCTGDLSNPPEFFCQIKQECAKIVTKIDYALRNIDPYWWRKNNHWAKSNLKFENGKYIFKGR